MRIQNHGLIVSPSPPDSRYLENDQRSIIAAGATGIHQEPIDGKWATECEDDLERKDYSSALHQERDGRWRTAAIDIAPMLQNSLPGPDGVRLRLR